MTRIIDITHTVRPSLTVWSGDTPVDITPIKEVGEDGARSTVSKVVLSSHAGTHMDAPAHFIENGAGIDTLDLSVLIGACVVVETDAPALGGAAFEAMAIPPGTRRLLVKTENSKRFTGAEPFFRDYVGVTTDGARWLVDRGIALIGIDYMSVAAYPDVTEVHHLLLGNSVVLLETLKLAAVVPGSYQLIALPLKLENVDGSPGLNEKRNASALLPSNSLEGQRPRCPRTTRTSSLQNYIVYSPHLLISEILCGLKRSGW